MEFGTSVQFSSTFGRTHRVSVQYGEFHSSLSLSLSYSLVAFEKLVMYSCSLHTPVEKQQLSSVFVLNVAAADATVPPPSNSQMSNQNI